MSSKKMTIIFPHVPKCGGTTIQAQLENMPLRVFLDYDAPPAHAGHGFHKCAWRNKDFGFLDFSNFDLVFGHFPVERYSSEKYRYVALCRDPYSRLLSQVNYLMERHKSGVALSPHAKNCAVMIESGEMTIPQYIRTTHIHNIYKLYLCGWPKDRFALIGDMTKYDAFLDNFEELIGHEIERDKNKRKMSYNLEISEKDNADIRSLLVDEFDYYRAFINGV